SRTPLFFLIIAVIINVVLDLIFIIYFGMGVEGAAIATVIAQVSSSVLCLVYIKKKMPLLQLRKKDFKFEKEEFAVHLNAALPMAFQSSIIAVGAIVLQAALNSLGTDVVAAQAAAGRIDQFANQPMMSFGIAMATFTAQNYGAKEYGRILQGVRQTLLMSVGFSLLAGAIVIFFGHFFVQLFVSPSETRVFELAQTYFNINGSLYWILAVLFILRYTLQGLGQSKIPTIAGMMELLMRSFAAIVLTGMWGYPGAAAASPLAWIGSVAVLLYSYMRSMKQLKHMGEEEHFTLEHAEAR
ncbi:TPA: MATE family efflux transporter, partial [Enterococcus faecium]|nr:MATE family efflux transporter [Enterococcus faecium]